MFGMLWVLCYLALYLAAFVALVLFIMAAVREWKGKRDD
jgi:hypothetical protein